MSTDEYESIHANEYSDDENDFMLVQKMRTDDDSKKSWATITKSFAHLPMESKRINTTTASAATVATVTPDTNENANDPANSIDTQPSTSSLVNAAVPVTKIKKSTSSTDEWIESKSRKSFRKSNSTEFNQSSTPNTTSNSATSSPQLSNRNIFTSLSASNSKKNKSKITTSSIELDQEVKITYAPQQSISKKNKNNNKNINTNNKLSIDSTTKSSKVNKNEKSKSTKQSSSSSSSFTPIPIALSPKVKYHSKYKSKQLSEEKLPLKRVNAFYKPAVYKEVESQLNSSNASPSSSSASTMASAHSYELETPLQSLLRSLYNYRTTCAIVSGVVFASWMFGRCHGMEVEQHSVMVM